MLRRMLQAIYTRHGAEFQTECHRLSVNERKFQGRMPILAVRKAVFWSKAAGNVPGR